MKNRQIALDIVYIISHGFAARMVLQTGLLKQLAQQDLKVGVISSDAGDPNLKYLADNFGIRIFEYKFSNNFWGENYWVRRRYVLEDIKDNPALWGKHIKAIKSNKSKHPWRRLRPYFNIWHYRFARLFPCYRKRFEKKEQEQLKSEKAEQLIREINPRILISTYPVNLQEALLLKAGHLNKQTLNVIHLLSWDNISSKGRFPVLADKYIAWGPIMKEEFQSYYGVSEKDIVSCGVPHFDIHYQTRMNPNPKPYLQELCLDPLKPYLFFAMSSPYFAPCEIEIVEWMAAAVTSGKFGNQMQFVVRPHPQNVTGNMMDSSWLPRLKKLHEMERTAVDFPKLNKESKLSWSMHEKDMWHLSHLLASAAVCLNSGSTVSIDALMAGAPVIITSFDADQKRSYWNSAKRLIDFIHLKKFINLGGVRVVNNFMELEVECNAYINNHQKDLEKRIYARDMECQNMEGLSTIKVVEEIKQMLKVS